MTWVNHRIKSIVVKGTGRVGLRTAAGFPSVQHSGHISVWRMTWVNHGIKSVIAKGTGKGLNGGWRRRGFLLLPGNMSAMVHLKRHRLKT